MSDDTVTLAGGLADRTAWRADRCPVGRALEVVGTRSAMLLMREAYYGTTRFDDFAARVGITDAVAAARLRELTEAGLLRKEAYQEPGRRTRYQYRLTEMGSDLFPALLALLEWGSKYLSTRPPLAFTHTGCDEPVGVEVRCAKGHHVPVGEITVAPAP